MYTVEQEVDDAREGSSRKTSINLIHTSKFCCQKLGPSFVMSFEEAEEEKAVEPRRKRRLTLVGCLALHNWKLVTTRELR